MSAVQDIQLKPLFAPLAELRGIGPALLRLLTRVVGGDRVIDLLFHLPESYLDRRVRPTIATAQSGQIATLAQIRAVTTTQIASLSTTQMAGLSSTQLSQIATQQMAGHTLGRADVHAVGMITKHTLYGRYLADVAQRR